MVVASARLSHTLLLPHLSHLITRTSVLFVVIYSHCPSPRSGDRVSGLRRYNWTLGSSAVRAPWHSRVDGLSEAHIWCSSSPWITLVVPSGPWGYEALCDWDASPLCRKPAPLRALSTGCTRVRQLPGSAVLFVTCGPFPKVSYDSRAVRSTLLECAVQWFSVCSGGPATITTVWFSGHSCQPRRYLVPAVTLFPCSLPLPSATTHPLSVSTLWPIKSCNTWHFVTGFFHLP